MWSGGFRGGQSDTRNTYPTRPASAVIDHLESHHKAAARLSARDSSSQAASPAFCDAVLAGRIEWINRVLPSSRNAKSIAAMASSSAYSPPWNCCSRIQPASIRGQQKGFDGPKRPMNLPPDFSIAQSAHHPVIFLCQRPAGAGSSSRTGRNRCWYWLSRIRPPPSATSLQNRPLEAVSGSGGRFRVSRHVQPAPPLHQLIASASAALTNAFFPS